ncbi:hypothetical protein [Actinoplanes sp. NPDC023714]|uniref:hypothetical protein n=1 Tax=Actinoplanes sp. NPDC023714 TaxID=3154322 RepID=UPI0033CE161A
MTPSDSPTPQPQDDAAAEPAPKKPLLNSWIFTALGGAVGAYFLISGALGVREKEGDGVFAILVAGIVVIVAAFAFLMYRSYKSDKAAKN